MFMYYFYFLQSLKKQDEIYSGSTNNLRLRFALHNQGKVFSTRRYMPWRLVYYEAFLSEKDARLREQKFKRHGKGNDELKRRIQNSLLSGNDTMHGVYPSPFLSKKGEGFTLIEILVVLGIVMVVVGLLGQIFSTVTNLQRQILTRQKMIDETRNAIDTLVEDFRGGQILYSAYVNPPTVPVSKLLPKLQIYGKDGTRLTVSQSTSRVPCGTAEDIRCILLERGTEAPIPLTGPTVHVASLSFMIDPLRDPFVLDAGVFLENAQPRVTMVMKLDAADPRLRNRFPITVQTTIGLRAILR